LQEAKDAGIPVILMDRKIDVSDKSLYTTCVGSDSFAEGSKAGTWLEEDLEKRGLADEEINIVILKGTQGASAQVGRSVGFSEVAAKHENWNILDQKYADFTAAKGKEVMADFLEKYPDIDVVVSQNDDMTFGAIEAIREAGRTVGIDGDITMISFDAVSEALELVAEGTINVDVECNPNQGEYISEIIQKLENGEEVEQQYYVEEDVFTIDNVTEEVLKGRTY
jgi:simple sugar transport system substrate-binding protein